MSKVVGSRQKLPYSLSWRLTVALFVERYQNFLIFAIGLQWQHFTGGSTDKGNPEQH